MLDSLKHFPKLTLKLSEIFGLNKRSVQRMQNNNLKLKMVQLDNHQWYFVIPQSRKLICVNSICSDSASPQLGLPTTVTHKCNLLHWLGSLGYQTFQLAHKHTITQSAHPNWTWFNNLIYFTPYQTRWKTGFTTKTQQIKIWIRPQWNSKQETSEEENHAKVSQNFGSQDGMTRHKRRNGKILMFQLKEK